MRPFVCPVSKIRIRVSYTNRTVSVIPPYGTTEVYNYHPLICSADDLVRELLRKIVNSYEIARLRSLNNQRTVSNQGVYDGKTT